MPKTTPSGQPRKEELPGTLRRSPEKAQRTFAKAHDSAAETYGEGERAHRVAYGAVKHAFEKKGDHWEPKDHKGPSDERAARSEEHTSELQSHVNLVCRLLLEKKNKKKRKKQ